jgi:RNA polymerase sigma factor (sigma-70 family)
VPESTEFTDLLAACRNGVPGAFDELVRRYKHHVRIAVRNRLSGALRKRFDSHDFTQDVWASFFRVTLDRLHLPDETALIAYLSQMARWKVGKEFRHQNTKMVAIGRDMPLDDAGEQLARVATPSAEVIARDRWEALTACLSEREKRLLEMVRDGHTHADIAREFGLSERTVQRMMARLQALTPVEKRQ